MRPMTLTLARSIAGSLGFPSKMPGSSYGLPASACITGSKLASIPGSACAQCYALRDTYTWPNTKKAAAKRLSGINHQRWADAMVRLLSHAHANEYRKIDLGLRGKKLARVGTRYRLNQMGFHRWHDSGDIQSVEHLSSICDVARGTPRIKHWLPTQELSMVRSFISRSGTIPDNLTIRVSSVMIDDKTRRVWPHTSSVHKTFSVGNAHVCPAPLQDHKCGECRACWSKDVAHVSYGLH